MPTWRRQADSPYAATPRRLRDTATTLQTAHHHHTATHATRPRSRAPASLHTPSAPLITWNARQNPPPPSRALAARSAVRCAAAPRHAADSRTACLRSLRSPLSRAAHLARRRSLRTPAPRTAPVSASDARPAPLLPRSPSFHIISIYSIY